MIRKTVLTTMALLSLLCVRVQAAPTQDVIKETIVKHSIEMNVDPALALSIAKKESGFRHELKSPYGAVGVFQLLPSTAQRMGFNPYYLSENIKAGLTYYKMMYKMFGSMELALAAYNAGPGNVKKYKAVPPYAETRRFVSKIMTDYHRYKANPDPMMVKAVKPVSPAKPKVQGTVAAKPLAPSNVNVQEVKNAKIEVVDETPIELEIETTTLAI